MGLLVGLGAGALVGVVAWAVLIILPETWQPSRTPIAIVFAIVAGLIGANAPTLRFVDDVERELLSSERTDEMAAAFKARDPEAFSAFVNNIRASMQGEDRSFAIDRARKSIMEAARRRMVHLPDGSIVEFYHLSRDEMRELSLSRPDLCSQLFLGQSLGAAPIMPSEALQRREERLLTMAFRAEDSAVVPLTRDELQIEMQGVAERTSAFVGESFDLLSSRVPPAGREIEYCQAAAEMLNQMAVVPEPARFFGGVQALETELRARAASTNSAP